MTDPTIRERLRELADGVRYAGGNGTSDYWRGFNDGIDRLLDDPAIGTDLDTLERRAIVAEKALERAIDETNEYMAPWVVEAEDVLEARAALEASQGSASSEEAQHWRETGSMPPPLREED